MKRAINSSIVDFPYFAVKAILIGSSASSVKELFTAMRVNTNKMNIYIKLKSFTFVTILHLDSTLALKKYKFLD